MMHAYALLKGAVYKFDRLRVPFLLWHVGLGLGYGYSIIVVDVSRLLLADA